MFRVTIVLSAIFGTAFLMAQWDEPFPDSVFCQSSEVIPVERIFYGDSECQWFMYTRPLGIPIDSMIPVVISAHGNGRPGHAQVARDAACYFNSAGFAFISWESWTYGSGPDSTRVICPDFVEYHISKAEYDARTAADFQRVLCYVKSNLDSLAIDSSEVFVTGRSRGTRMSFKDLNRLPEDSIVPCTEPLMIKGVYLYQAFPDGEFKSPADEAVYDYPTEDYPPLCLGFDFEPGIYSNSHDVVNASPILERYQCLGLSATLRQEVCDEDDYEPAAIDFFMSLRDSASAEVYQLVYPEYRRVPPYSDDDMVACTELQNVIRAPQNCKAIVTNGKVKFQCDASETWFGIDEVPGARWAAPESVTCEMRGRYSFHPSITDKMLEKRMICSGVQRTANFTFESGGRLGAAGDSLSFPSVGNGYDICRFNTAQEDAGRVIAQIRCRISPEIGTYSNTRKWWTPWSDVMIADFECASDTSGTERESNQQVTRKLIQSEGFLNIKVYDVSGRHIASYSNMDAYTLEQILNNLPTGLYVCQLVSEDGSFESFKIHR